VCVCVYARVYIYLDSHVAHDRRAAHDDDEENRKVRIRAPLAHRA